MNARAKDVECHLGQYAAYEDLPFAALNTAFMEDGAYISVPDRTVVESPIQVLFYTDAAESIVTYPRNLIVAGRESQVRVIETYAGTPGAVYLTNGVTEVAAAENAGCRSLQSPARER